MPLARALFFAALGLLLPARLAFAQCQEAKLVPADPKANANFGWSVSISGATALVGAYRDDAGDRSGSAYVFERQGSAWVQTQKLNASDGVLGDEFGYAVALSGNVAAIGAQSHTPQGIFAAGAVYIFERAPGGWVETAKIWPSDALPNQFFGRALDFTGEDRLLAGKEFGESAYVFERQGASWVQVQKLVASGGFGVDRFGKSVSISGDRALIGAPAADVNGMQDHGAAYVFELQGATWVQVKKLIPSDGQAADFAGFSVAIDGDTAMMDAPSHDAAGWNAGAVYVFEKGPADWSETQKILASDPAANDKFGLPIALDGELVVIGAQTDDDACPPPSSCNSGSAYAFRRTASGWVQIGKILASDSVKNDLFGAWLGLSGTTVLVGAHAADPACPSSPTCNSGAAYVFELGPDAVQYCSCASASPCGNPDDHGGCANSTGHGAVLAACGSGSVATDNLRLEVTKLPPNVFGLVFMGPAQAQTPFGDGLLCVGSGNTGFFRFPPGQASPGGSIGLGPGVAGMSQGFLGAGQIAPGQTWNLQGWYRDPNGPCGSGFNLSNGVSVLFEP